MHLILCRNVLIYFNRALQDRALTTFCNSLHYNGFLCLGSKETVQFSAIEKDFVDFAPKEKIYQSKHHKPATKELLFIKEDDKR
jgi:chemotaxis protein methyltransferase CheR